MDLRQDARINAMRVAQVRVRKARGSNLSHLSFGGSLRFLDTPMRTVVILDQ